MNSQTNPRVFVKIAFAENKWRTTSAAMFMREHQPFEYLGEDRLVCIDEPLYCESGDIRLNTFFMANINSVTYDNLKIIFSVLSSLIEPVIKAELESERNIPENLNDHKYICIVEKCINDVFGDDTAYTRGSGILEPGHPAIFDIIDININICKVLAMHEKMLLDKAEEIAKTPVIFSINRYMDNGFPKGFSMMKELIRLTNCNLIDIQTEAKTIHIMDQSDSKDWTLMTTAIPQGIHTALSTLLRKEFGTIWVDCCVEQIAEIVYPRLKEIFGDDIYLVTNDAWIVNERMGDIFCVNTSLISISRILGERHPL